MKIIERKSNDKFVEVSKSTGECVNLEVSFSEKNKYMDTGFKKFWLKNYFIQVVNFGVKAEIIRLYLFLLMDKDNMIISTQSDIIKGLKKYGVNVSRNSVSNIMQELINADMLHRISGFVYMVNPRYISQKEGTGRQKDIADYASLTSKAEARKKDIEATV